MVGSDDYTIACNCRSYLCARTGTVCKSTRTNNLRAVLRHKSSYQVHARLPGKPLNLTQFVHRSVRFSNALMQGVSVLPSPASHPSTHLAHQQIPWLLGASHIDKSNVTARSVPHPSFRYLGKEFLPAMVDHVCGGLTGEEYRSRSVRTKSHCIIHPSYKPRAYHPSLSVLSGSVSGCPCMLECAWKTRPQNIYRSCEIAIQKDQV
jgi:hypothetical protein